MGADWVVETLAIAVQVWYLLLREEGIVSVVAGLSQLLPGATGPGTGGRSPISDGGLLP